MKNLGRALLLSAAVLTLSSQSIDKKISDQASIPNYSIQSPYTPDEFDVDLPQAELLPAVFAGFHVIVKYTSDGKEYTLDYLAQYKKGKFWHMKKVDTQPEGDTAGWH